jgi:predicted nuclease of predicted toxin-antitoxin system
MRWMVDECVHGYIVQKLKTSGHDVVLVTDIFPSSDDEPILSLARDEHRILLTQDSDFGEMIFRGRFSGAAGIVFLRLRMHPVDLVWQRLKMVIDELGEKLVGHYVVISAGRVRSRPLE